jgi:late competence protein required for DNA uptake (superfamily II DNA/RNA helicase)
LEKKSLQGAVNELKGRMLELMVYRALNKYRKTAQPIADFRQKVRPIDENAQVLQKLLTAVSTSRFEIIF